MGTPLSRLHAALPSDHLLLGLLFGRGCVSRCFSLSICYSGQTVFFSFWNLWIEALG